jgi:hypothetical protein
VSKNKFEDIFLKTEGVLKRYELKEKEWQR